MGEEGRLCSLGSKVCWRVEGVSVRVCGGDAPMICRGRRLRYLFHSDGAALKVCVVQVPYGVILLLYSVHPIKVQRLSANSVLAASKPFETSNTSAGLTSGAFTSHCQRVPAQ